MSRFNPTFLSILFFSILIFSACNHREISKDAPNILFIIADDWSYPHASIYGDPVVQTPNFDQIAQGGILFHQAYVSSPSCSPSRASIVTGQDFWRLKEGANLYGSLAQTFPTYTEMLDESGYHVGYSGKGWAPGPITERKQNPAGKFYPSFASFLQEQPKKKPFCYWYGSTKPHRPFEARSGIKAGIDTAAIQIPAHLPNNKVIKSDMADYYKAIQDFDQEIGSVLSLLEENDQLTNTIIVVTSDNGMPFPAGKANLYNWGTHVPLAIKWPKGITTATEVNDFISLTDLAPTFLELAGVPTPDAMTGRSLASYFTSSKKQGTDKRTAIYFGRERHVPGQESGDWSGYPMRAIQTNDFLLIKNFKADHWPAGTPNTQNATLYPSFYGDIDKSPTKTYMHTNKDKDNRHLYLFERAFEKRPGLELYDLKTDPDQLHNVADAPEYQQYAKALEEQLMTRLQETNDPRANNSGAIFDFAPYTGGTPGPDGFKNINERFATQVIKRFPSKYVNWRTVEILTPINVPHDASFPVLYMLDGQNIFHSFENMDGTENKGLNIDAVIDSLNLGGQLPQMIVVGIFYTEKRMSDYMPEQPRELLKERIATTKDLWYKRFAEYPPNSDNELRFIVEELKPYIDSNYKTQKDMANTFIGGWSIGGLLSTYAVCEYPDVFGGAVSFSPHWPALDGVFVEYLKDKLPNPVDHRIYLDYGRNDLKNNYDSLQIIVEKTLQQAGFVKDQNWITLTLDNETTLENDWPYRLATSLQFLFN